MKFIKNLFSFSLLGLALIPAFSFAHGVQIIRGDQVQSMGTALATGGSGLLKIGIQLMPYAIAFTIILLIFGLIKNWSKLRNKWGVEPPVNMLGESWAKKHPKAYNRAFRRWDRRSSRRLARKYGGNRKDYYSGKAG